MFSQLLTFLVGMGSAQAQEIGLARNEEARYDNITLPLVYDYVWREL